MGCKCTHYSKEEDKNEIPGNQYSQNQINNLNGAVKFEPQIGSLKNDSLVNPNSHIIMTNKTNLINDNSYAKEVLEYINNIRARPKDYAEIIRSKKENIIFEKEKCVYKQKVKVALYRGKEAFDEAASFLEELEPLPPLTLKEEISVPLPEDEETAKNKKYLEAQVRKMEEEQNIIVGTYFKELIKLPEVSALLMAVDDSGKNSGRKRMAILSDKYRYIGISSRFFGTTFIGYFTFTE